MTLDLFFFYNNIKDNDRNLCQDLLTIENTDSDLKVHALHYANELLVPVRLSFQKRSQTRRSTCRNNTKKCLGKELWRVLVVNKSTDHDEPHFDLFSATISTSKKMIFIQSVRRARAEKGIARHIDASSVVWLGNKYGLLTKCEVKMAGYWPSSFFACLWIETKSGSINSQKKNEAKIQPSWPNKLGQ